MNLNQKRKRIIQNHKKTELEDSIEANFVDQNNFSELKYSQQFFNNYKKPFLKANLNKTQFMRATNKVNKVERYLKYLKID